MREMVNADCWIPEGNQTKDGGNHEADQRSPKNKEEVTRTREKKIGGCVSKMRLDKKTGL